MKTKPMKLKLIAAAVALAAAGNASAAINLYNSGNGELFFNIYDPVAKQSFVYDLTPQPGMPDVAVNDFLPGDLDNKQGYTGVVAGELVPGATVTPDGRSLVEQSGVSLSWTINTSNAQWSSYLNSGVTTPNMKWNVVAGDSTGASTGKHNRRYLTTVAPGVTDINGSSSQFSNYGLTTALPTQVNSLNPGDAADSSYYYADIPGYNPEYFGEGFGEFWASNLPVNSTAGVGQSADFWYLTGRSNAHISEQYENGAKWTFSLDGANNGTLTYSTNAAVAPIPVPAALWLLGSGLIGLVGVARRRKTA